MLLLFVKSEARYNL